MAINKKSEFSPQDQRLADFAKVLSHPARIAILKVLAQKGVCICGEIVEVLPLAQSTVSQHLKDMKAAGLITGEVEGTKSCYCIDWNALKAGCDAVQAMAKDLAVAKKSCC
jgi:ArsR family transcriptional regulator, arsenate/arsenite/antimonite-responsive transcriptional repressor